MISAQQFAQTQVASATGTIMELLTQAATQAAEIEALRAETAAKDKRIAEMEEAAKRFAELNARLDAGVEGLPES